MRKTIMVFTALLVVIGLLGFTVSSSAKAIGFTMESLAPNEWTVGEEVVVDMVENPAPEWLQLLAKPIKIAEPGEICHDFRGGQFYWVGEIRQLVDGKWVKIASTTGWEPNEEGKFVICANAQTAGIYALFAYFSPPEGYVPSRRIFN